jgi:hypothetical protein
VDFPLALLELVLFFLCLGLLESALKLRRLVSPPLDDFPIPQPQPMTLLLLLTLQRRRTRLRSIRLRSRSTKLSL